MERYLDEVLASQETMLRRSNQLGANVSKEKLRDVFERQLAKFNDWVATRNDIRILRVGHREMIDAPRDQLEKINPFLDQILDLDKAAKAVDGSLYRKRQRNG